MKRQIKSLKRGICGCCPGHDTWPEGSYNSLRSKHARAKYKAKEHRLVRRVLKCRILPED